jgi:hypothetical protein
MSILADYIIWWYTAGLVKLFKYLKAFILILADSFSLKMILTTFFKPWKKDVTPTGGLPLSVRFKVWGFNLISIGFGMVIKFFAFIAFLICFLALICLEITAFAVWIFLPLLAIETLVIGIIYLTRI